MTRPYLFLIPINVRSNMVKCYELFLVESLKMTFLVEPPLESLKKQIKVQPVSFRQLISWIRIMKNFHYLVRRLLFDVLQNVASSFFFRHIGGMKFKVILKKTMELISLLAFGSNHYIERKLPVKSAHQSSTPFIVIFYDS